MKLSLHISPTRVDFSTVEGATSGRRSEELDDIAEQLRAQPELEVRVLEAPVGDAPDSDFWLVFEADLPWHLDSLPETRRGEAARRFVLLRPSRERAFALLEELDVAAVVAYEGARAWAEPAKGGLVVRRDVAAPLGGELGVGLPFFKQTDRHASWTSSAYPTLAAQLVAYLRRIASPEVADAHGMTALHQAAAYGDVAVVKSLLEQGATVDATNATGDTALMMAAAAGELEIVRMLLAAGADTSQRDRRGDTALQIAEEKEQDEVAELLRSVEFPIGETFDRGAYRIERHLQGQGSQKLFLGRRMADGAQLLVAFDWMSRLDLAELRRSITYDVPGVLPLEFVGKVDITPGGDISNQSAAWGLVERATAGAWLPSLLGTFHAEVVFETEPRVLPSYNPATALPDALSLGRSAGKILATAAKRGRLLTRVRPEYMWAERVGGVLEVTGLSARGDAFFAKTRADAVTWPVFDRFYYAPEAHADPDERALVFSLSIMIAEWATGRFPYATKYHRNGPLSGEHVPLALPASLAQLLSRGMRVDPAQRPGLDELIAGL